MLNLKIESPDDDNYSDDELAFLPFYTYLTMADPGTASYKAARASVERSWLSVRGLRSALWNTIYIGTNGTNFDQNDVDSIGWNLRTWPVELVSWPVKNSGRRDLTFDLDADRSGTINGDSVCGWARVLKLTMRTFLAGVLTPLFHFSSASASFRRTSATNCAGTQTRTTLTVVMACQRAIPGLGSRRIGWPATTA